MKSILLTKQIEDLSIAYADHLFDERSDQFIKPLEKLKKLKTAVTRKRTLHQDYALYLTTLIRIYPLLNKLKPGQFQKIDDKIFARYTGVDLSKSMKIAGKSMRFYKHISAAMRYDAVRDQEFLHYAKEMGIRACVYCNANYATSFKKTKNGRGDMSWIIFVRSPGILIYVPIFLICIPFAEIAIKPN